MLHAELIEEERFAQCPFLAGGAEGDHQQNNSVDIAWENYIQDDYSAALRQQREPSRDWLHRQLEQT